MSHILRRWPIVLVVTAVVWLIVVQLLEMMTVDTYLNREKNTTMKEMLHPPTLNEPIMANTKPFNPLPLLDSAVPTFSIVKDQIQSTRQEHPSSSRTTGSSSSNLCLSVECIHTVARDLARAFPDRHDHEWICHEPSPAPHNYTREGILLVKTFKAASSTVAGVVLGIARNHATKNGSWAWVKWHHTPGMEYKNRNPRRSFLLTSLRDPAARAISRYFYTAVSWQGIRPTETSMIEWLKDNHPQYGSVAEQGGFQFRFGSLRPLPIVWDKRNKTHVSDPLGVQGNVRQILFDYDFILIAERLDESLVALSMVMGLEVDEVVVMDAKVAGGSTYLFEKSPGKPAMCWKLVRSFRPKRVNDYIKSAEWRAINYGDYLLHAAASYSLDSTIDRLGRQNFDRRLLEYRRLKHIVEFQCANATFLPCSVIGKPQRAKSKRNCLGDDSGCGYKCIEAVLSKDRASREG